MLYLNRRWYLWSLSAAAALLSSCGGVTSPIAGPAIAPDLPLSSGVLLYVSNNNQTSIGVYTFSHLKEVATMPVTRGVAGLCSDSDGNVWVLAGSGEYISLTEYAHGGGRPIATLFLSGRSPFDCRVDAAGSLAVVHDANYVSIFQNEQGSPQTYKDSGIGEIRSLTYDAKGDLFVYGTKATGEMKYPIVGELVSGGTAFSNLTFHQNLPDMTFAQWDGSDLLLAGVTNRSKSTWTETVWTVAVSQSKITILHDKTFDAPKTHGMGERAVVQGTTLIQQDNGGNFIYRFSYSSGGSPTNMFHTGRGGRRTGLAIST
jgi:hypothetical protein